MFPTSKCKIAFIVMAFLPLFSFAQAVREAGSVDFLVYDEGFKGIGLGADINLLPREKLSFLDNSSKLDADSCLMYEYKDTTIVKLAQDLELDAIALRTYNNKIVNIYLFFKRADGYKLLRNFLTTYGLFTSKPDDYVDVYDWKSKRVNLSLRYELKMDLGVAIFSSNILENMLAQKSIKRMESIAQQANTPAEDGTLPATIANQ